MAEETQHVSNPLLEVLLSRAYTADVLFHRINLLRTFCEDLFFTKKHEKPSTILLEKFCEARGVPREDCEALLTALPVITDSITPTGLHDYFETLSQDAEALPDFVMITPVAFGKEAVLRVSAWVRQHVSGTALLTFKVEAVTIGGCAYIWRGIRRDIALGYYLSKHRKDFDALLKAYGSSNEKTPRERP